MNKLLIIIFFFLFLGSICFAFDGSLFIDSFLSKIFYLKDWIMGDGITQEFFKELNELKSEIPYLWIKIKELLS
jgi:hypothetical protein